MYILPQAVRSKRQEKKGLKEKYPYKIMHMISLYILTYLKRKKMQSGQVEFQPWFLSVDHEASTVNIIEFQLKPLKN